MTPALWAELIGAVVTVSTALAAYLRANTAKGKADTAITALNSHVMTHVINRKMQTMSEISAENAPAMQDPAMANPVGQQGASLMGVQPVPVVTPEPAPEPPQEEAPPPANPVIIADPQNTDDTKIYSKDDLRKLLNL